MSQWAFDNGGLPDATPANHLIRPPTGYGLVDAGSVHDRFEVRYDLAGNDVSVLGQFGVGWSVPVVNILDLREYVRLLGDGWTQRCCQTIACP
jgi:hypothetical protein